MILSFCLAAAAAGGAFPVRAETTEPGPGEHRCDAVDKTLYLDSKIGDFTSFLSTATIFGNVVYRAEKPR